MSSCQRYQEMIEEYLAEEISGQDQIDLQEHCLACSECAGLLELHQSLLGVGAEVSLPERAEFRDMREAVLAMTEERNQNRKSSELNSGFLVDLGKLWCSHPLSSGFATAAVLIFAVSLGHFGRQDQPFEEELMRHSRQLTAAHQNNLDDHWDSPFSYANVSVRDQGQGQLALSFDASRHVDLQVSQESPLAREVLLHAIMEPSTLGSRLKAMEITTQIRDEMLKDALVSTLLNDPNPAVRVNALAVLAKYPFDQKSQDAFIQSLSQEQDVQILLNALEELTKQNVNQEIILDAVEKNDPDGEMAFLKQAVLRI